MALLVTLRGAKSSLEREPERMNRRFRIPPGVGDPPRVSGAHRPLRARHVATPKSSLEREAEQLGVQGVLPNSGGSKGVLPFSSTLRAERARQRTERTFHVVGVKKSLLEREPEQVRGSKGSPLFPSDLRAFRRVSESLGLGRCECRPTFSRARCRIDEEAQNGGELCVQASRSF
jgi:hypothetical protein